jgi:hypothetical protein
MLKFFLYLNLGLVSVPHRWAEVCTLPLPVVCLCCIITLLSLSFTIPVSLFGVLGQVAGPDIWKSLEFDPGT